MDKHHIIPLHEWKRRINPKATRKNKDFNSLDNIVWLTLEQHAQVHQLLWELNGQVFDLIAYQGLSGKIGKEEASKIANSVAHIGRKWTEEHKKSHSVLMKGNQHLRGKKFTRSEQQIKAMSQRMMGKKQALGKTWKKSVRTEVIS